MSRKQPRKSQCPWCSRVVNVTKNGSLVVHKRPRYVNVEGGFKRVYQVECVGSRTEALLD